MATHPNILALKILWAEEPGGLQSMGSQESDTIEHILHQGLCLSRHSQLLPHRTISIISQVSPVH